MILLHGKKDVRILDVTSNRVKERLLRNYVYCISWVLFLHGIVLLLLVLNKIFESLVLTFLIRKDIATSIVTERLIIRVLRGLHNFVSTLRKPVLC